MAKDEATKRVNDKDYMDRKEEMEKRTSHMRERPPFDKEAFGMSDSFARSRR